MILRHSIVKRVVLDYPIMYNGKFTRTFTPMSCLLFDSPMSLGGSGMYLCVALIALERYSNKHKEMLLQTHRISVVCSSYTHSVDGQGKRWQLLAIIGGVWLL